ncbi:hypothetical protein AL755_00830 (plasmid) [Arthrobacter sp. ERGS1:01]|uniref:TetR/AcrR family transcriptional regulator n=1 Tax=Arthrobacter sp. ERGS1:01 TaxID=1704044 RepID=UPI0006B590EB|nr:TetR/AcrR family transcriptional regulator [Arthrobacter sp. ERGS1:01]ALE04287.1 hypothetical protein AL755_00830 [Arthrobacter sp. ERGS1:01]
MALDNQTRILEACSSCIAENGVRGMRVQDVARKAGVSSGLLYYHFTDRDGLLAATLEYVNVSSLADHGTAASGDTGSFGAIRTLLLDEIRDDESVRAKSIVWNEIRAIAVFEPLLAEHLANSTKVWQDHLAGLLTQQSGIPQERADEIALLLTALVEGLSGRWLSGLITTEEARAALGRGLDSTLPREILTTTSQ